MADELTSQQVAPAAPSQEQAQPTSQPAPQPTQPEREPKTPAPAQGKPVNLQEFPEFKKWQASINRTMQQKEAEHKAQIQRMQQQVEQMMTRDMSGEELTQHEIRKRDEAYQELQSRYNDLQQTYAADVAKAEIARRAGVSPEVFADAQDPDEAWEMALTARLRLEKEQMEAAYKDKLAASPGNSPDLGVGKPAASATRSFTDTSWETNTGLRDFYRELQDEFES